MTLTQPEPTARKTDTNTLLALGVAAIAARHEELRKRDRLDDQNAVRRARAEALATFGQDAATALGEWLPSPEMPERMYQAFVELAPRTSLICTTPRFPSGTRSETVFEVLAYCGSCSSHSTTAVGSLAELAGALRTAGVR
ncbi:hypothetical protein [Streptomyces sp. NPDC006855]|uniref:hypothetical protein n=1 Tax=Streptomyces sp. NPDC006855 TaxID=3364765 RepID=UPI0036CC4970